MQYKLELNGAGDCTIYFSKDGGRFEPSFAQVHISLPDGEFRIVGASHWVNDLHHISKPYPQATNFSQEGVDFFAEVFQYLQQNSEKLYKEYLELHKARQVA